MKIGDKVSFLNAVGGGIVKGFQGKDIVYVEEEDGFETPVLRRECIVKSHSFHENDFFENDALMCPVIANDVPNREILVSEADILEAMNQKVCVDRPNKKQAPQQKNTNIIIEVDLHINEFLDSTSGMNNTDMLNVQLEKFRETMGQYKSKKGQKIVFIHGKGEGVLRSALMQELKTKYKNCLYQDASFKEYGFGATMITIK